MPKFFHFTVLFSINMSLFTLVIMPSWSRDTVPALGLPMIVLFLTMIFSVPCCKCDCVTPADNGIIDNSCIPDIWTYFYCIVRVILWELFRWVKLLDVMVVFERNGVEPEPVNSMAILTKEEFDIEFWFITVFLALCT